MTFHERLNCVFDRLVSPELLNNEGIGNEIGFYIFDYPPDQELAMRRWLKTLPEYIHRLAPSLRFQLINLFGFMLEYMQERKILDRSFEMQKSRGNDALLKALRGPLDETKMAEWLVRHISPSEQDLVLLFGIGECWPLLRSHALLNNLHANMGDTPLVMFYPGIYDQQSLSLFGKLSAQNYYRAFRLIP